MAGELVEALHDVVEWFAALAVLTRGSSGNHVRADDGSVVPRSGRVAGGRVAGGRVAGGRVASDRVAEKLDAPPA